MSKKIFKITIAILAAFALCGVAAAVTDRMLLPWLGSKDSLKRYKFFQKMNENVTVINKTEQITVKEDFSVASTTQSILPSIVSIITYQKEEGGKDPAINIKTSQDIQNSIKTGLIITSDGLIMSVHDTATTAKTEDAEKHYKVLASDGREFDATLKAVDPYSNLAFYKVEASNLAAPVFGNSDELETGEKIIIAGNASGEYQNTYSLGIIKEKDRTFSLLNSELSSSEKREGAIITDAQIDQENVGGPVIDFNGSIVGIANLVEKDGKKEGFIIPINEVRESIDLVMKNGDIKRPVLGVYYLSINREISLLNGLSVNQGALVYSFLGQQGLAVIKNSSADTAGVKIGDIITEVNGEKVTLEKPLSSHISRFSKGDEVPLKIIRAEETIELKTKLN